MDSSGAPGLGCVVGDKTITHGNNAPFYSATIGDCSTITETRTCTNGVLSGSFPHMSCTADPCQTGPIGTVCVADGSIYIGMNGSYRIYARAGPDSSTGIAWKTANSNTTGTDSASDGTANTDAMIAAGAAAHPAAQMCRSHGAQWYVPAHDELDLFWLNRAQINLASIGIDTSGAFYRGSNQVSATYASFQRFNDGSKTGVIQFKTYTTSMRLRCVRREAAGGPCGGTSVGGFCWYKSANSGNCTTACATHGGYNTATLTYAGSAGTDSNCQAVMDALGGMGSGAILPSSIVAGIGCSLTEGGRIRASNPTTESAVLPNAVRACACNN